MHPRDQASQGRISITLSFGVQDVISYDCLFCYDVQYMYDDEDDDEYEYEQDSAQDLETRRREDAAVASGKENRAFYDGLAKEEDIRHNAMRIEMQKRALKLGELRQKFRHKEAELRALESKIHIEEDRIDFEAKKKYRLGSHDASEVGVGGVTLPIPILSKDIDPKDSGAEFSIERAQASIKQLKEEEVELKKVLREMNTAVSDEARALSQLQHSLLRM